LGIITNLMNEPLDDSLAKIYANPVIITTGRITYQKGQWHLIRSFKVIKDTIPNAKLIVLGDFNSADSSIIDYILTLCDDLSLRYYREWANDEAIDQSIDIFFMGFQHNPYKFLKNATLYAFPSLFEGFPNALVEAMICGLPVVSADCQSGPREILAPGTDFQNKVISPELAQFGALLPVCNGVLLDATHSLNQEESYWCDTITRFLRDEDLRKKYIELSKKRASDFDVGTIMKDWKQLINDVSPRSTDILQ